MHVPVRELVLAVAVVAGSANAFAPGVAISRPCPAAAAVRHSPGSVAVAPSFRAERPIGVLGLQSALQNADKINRVAPRNWKLGTDYVKATKLAPGDLVLVERSDGTRRYGEVIKSAGGPFASQYEICVEVERGQPASTKIENLSNCFVPTATGSQKPAGSSIANMAAQPRVPQQRTVAAAPPRAARMQQARGRAPPPAKKPAAAPAALVPNAEILKSKSVPATWEEGIDFVKAMGVTPGDLVVVDGPTGLFFGTVEKKTGLPWQQQYSVIVQVMTDGSAAARETVDMATLYLPTPASLDKLSAPPAAAISGFFKNFFSGPQELPPPPPPKPPPASTGKTALSDFLPKEAGTILFDLQKKVTGGEGSEKPPPPPPKAPADVKEGFLNSLAANPAFKDLGLDGVAETLEELKTGTKKTQQPPAVKPSTASSTPTEGKQLPDIKSVEDMQKQASKAADLAQEQLKTLASDLLTNLEQVIEEKLPAEAKKETKTQKEASKADEPKSGAPSKAQAPPPPPPPLPAKEETKPATTASTPPPPPPAPSPPAAPAQPSVTSNEAEPKAEAVKKPLKQESSGPQPPPPKPELPEDDWCIAKKNALTVNLERAEREADLNLGLGPEWDSFVKGKKE